MDSRLDERVYIVAEIEEGCPFGQPHRSPPSVVVLQFGSARELATIQEAFRARP